MTYDSELDLSCKQTSGVKVMIYVYTERLIIPIELIEVIVLLFCWLVWTLTNIKTDFSKENRPKQGKKEREKNIY